MCGRSSGACALSLLLSGQPRRDVGLSVDEVRLFAHAGDDVAPSSERFWHDAYALRRGTDGSVACPDSLRCLAADVLSAGKAAVLMRHSRASGSRHAAP